MTRLICIALLGLGACSLKAAEPGSLSLEQSLAQAREHNPELHKLRLAADAASWKGREALASQIPHLDLKASHYLGAEYSRLGVIFGGVTIGVTAGSGIGVTAGAESEATIAGAASDALTAGAASAGSGVLIACGGSAGAGHATGSVAA